MLSRIANNLYWAGRNLERMDHIARFVPVNYFASLDAPTEIDSQFMLRNINSMAGNLSFDKDLVENEVLNNIAFDLKNPSSLNSCVHLMRENFRGTQDAISSELWEAINGLYRYIQAFKQDEYLNTKMNEFMLNVQNHVAISRAKLDSSLLHDQRWSLIKIGMMLERSTQITRLIQLKLYDEIALKGKEAILIDGEFGNLLKSLEAFDMNRKFYKRPVNKTRTLEFLIFNEKFPRSLAFCLKELSKRIGDLALTETGKENSIMLITSHLRDELNYFKIGDIASEEIGFLETVQERLDKMNTILTTKYFFLKESTPEPNSEDQ